MLEFSLRYLGWFEWRGARTYLLALSEWWGYGLVRLVGDLAYRTCMN